MAHGTPQLEPRWVPQGRANRDLGWVLDSIVLVECFPSWTFELTAYTCPTVGADAMVISL